MARTPLSIRRRMGLSLVALISVSYGLLIVTTELVISRDRLQRHERLVMATAESISQRLATRNPQAGAGIGVEEVSVLLNDFSATRVLVWLSRPQQAPVFPRSPAVQGFFKDPRLLQVAGVDAPGMQKPRAFTYGGETYFTCSMPLANGQGVLRFLEDVGVSPASRRENLILLLMAWLLLVVIGTVLISRLTTAAIRPLERLERLMDEMSLKPAGVVASERIPVQAQPLELQAIANAYNRLIERLEKTWTQQQLFMRAISHELLTPITLIGGHARRLRRHADTSVELDQAPLASIEEESTRMDRLVRNLLDLSRGESGNLSLTFQAFEPRLVLQDMLKDLAALPWGSRVRLDPDAAAGPDAEAVLVQADPDRLRQCVLNALENAAKYSGPEQPIELSMHNTPTEVKIRIRDHGPGIAEDERELVFQPFYRSTSARSEKGGSGIGLAVVRLLTQSMGGTVEFVDSSPQGSTLEFSLPISHVGS